ncbi:MAG TPA: Clp protease N-terminal domain-containing protein [Pseudonocardiaceae bacterium]|nr:Clp protease N-terminal domain-containing protein [Pseudonocardiaceae bacterium]
MFERFTAAGRDVVIQATGEAVALGDPAIGTGHMLLALLDERAGPASAALRAAGLSHDLVRAELARRSVVPLLDPEEAEALKSVGIDLDAVLARMTESFGADALASGQQGDRRGRRSLRFDAGAKKTMQHSLREAVARHDRSLGPEHLVLGLLAEDNTATTVLDRVGVDRAELRANLLAALDEAA